MYPNVKFVLWVSIVENAIIIYQINKINIKYNRFLVSKKKLSTKVRSTLNVESFTVKTRRLIFFKSFSFLHQAQWTI